jgi:hypothetical protein
MTRTSSVLNDELQPPSPEANPGTIYEQRDSVNRDPFFYFDELTFLVSFSDSDEHGCDVHRHRPKIRYSSCPGITSSRTLRLCTIYSTFQPQIRAFRNVLRVFIGSIGAGIWGRERHRSTKGGSFIEKLGTDA